jgi:hypothetical protein
MLRHRKIKVHAAWALLLACLAAGPAFGGTCSNPAGNEADQIYNGDHHTWQFCNGTNWLSYSRGGYCTIATSGYSPTSPSNSGYFVLSSGTYNGNLGGRTGADATCLTEVTTNTGWMGYATANSNGQLIATKVHAFICDTNMCNNPMPLTKYYFANAGNGAAGGASFTTDSNGLGPNDSANWSGSTYFGATYSYWSARNSTSNTQWGDGNVITSNFGCISNWTNSGGTPDQGEIGTSASTTSTRWVNGGTFCNNTENLICFVNP